MMYFNESKHELLGKFVIRMVLLGYKGVCATEKTVSEMSFPPDEEKHGKYMANIGYLSTI